tara:strand:+ start:326 stop:1237 length:912 start_codon:yes stop_codon:yes gene_type:complete
MYFKNFPKLAIESGTGTTSGANIATDILRRVGFNNEGVTASNHFIKYNISDWETPESISDNLYGSPEYHWVVMMFNNKHDIFFEWPLSSRKFEKYITKKYDGVTLFLDGYTGATNGISGSISINDTMVKTAGAGVTGWGGLVSSYDPVHQSVRLTGIGSGYEFSEGDLVKTFNATGGVLLENSQGEATVRRIVTDSTQAVHHFETAGSTWAGYDDVGGGEETSKIRIDPLVQYDGTGLTSMGSGGITFGSTVLYGYIYNDSSNYVKTNYDYELEENENKRIISLLNPEYLTQVVNEFKELIKR